VLLFSAFVFASAPFLYLFVETWWQLALVRFYHGFATAIFIPVTEATVAEQFPFQCGERISLLHSINGVGRTLAPLLGGAILALTNNGFHAVYLAVGVAGVTTFVMAFLLLTEKKKPVTEPADAKKVAKMVHCWRGVIQNRGAVLVSLVQASQYYVYGAVEFFIVGYALEVAGLDAFYAGLFLTAQVATVILTRPVLGRLSDRKGRRIPIVLGSILGAALLFAIPFTTQLWLLLLIAVGYGVGFAAVISSTSPLMSELAPAGLVGSSMGFLSTMMDVGQTMGPIVSGFILASVFQYTGLFASLSLLLLASAAVFAVWGTTKKQQDSPVQCSRGQ
jgi:MFS family permease